jgi:hypothetical protein
MKALIPILIGLLVVGCGKSTVDGVKPEAQVSEPFSMALSESIKDKRIYTKKTVGKRNEYFNFTQYNADGTIQEGVDYIKGNSILGPWVDSRKTKYEVEGLTVKIKWTIGGKSLLEFAQKFPKAEISEGDKIETTIVNQDDASRDYGKKKEDVITVLKVISGPFKPSINVANGSSGQGLTIKDVVGKYEVNANGLTGELVFYENGTVEAFLGGKTTNVFAKWKLVEEQVHFEDKDGNVMVYKIESNGDLISIAAIRNGKRSMPKKVRTLEKLNENPSKGGDNNSTTAKPVKELTPEDQKALRESVVGTYEKKTAGISFRLVLLENGVCEAYRNGKKRTAKWSISENGEFHVDESGDGSIGVSRINKDSSLTYIAYILNGKRTDVTENFQTTFKKIK